MKTLSLLFVLFPILFTCGCKSFRIGNTILTPYDVGRDITVVYLLSEDHLPKDKVIAVKALYISFSEIMDEAEKYESTGEFPFDSILEKSLESKIKDTTVLIFASKIANRYWENLNSRFNFTSSVIKDQIEILKEFRRGIEDALEDYRPEPSD